ncbi:hypothetical protein [Leisingera aquimarina]|uniref:hypothetical protein n=1 Tax=Leisingera aquimarina TaxID=476529 RepID=UPI000483716B|nr:hypothetical protein [Leisingera aquimarina]
MITKFSKPVQSLACCALLAACGGVPASNELQLDNDGNGRFSGVAGADWTAQEIRTHVSGMICSNGPVGELRFSMLPSAPEYTIFSGSCASSGDGLASSETWQNRVVTAPSAPEAPAVVSAGNSAAWDGSTPFVD